MKTRRQLYVAALALVLIPGSLAMAQPGRGRGGGGGGQLDLLRNSQIREELEIVDDQIEQIEELVKKSQNVFREVFREVGADFRNMTDEQRTELREKMQEKTEEIQKELGGVLLPHQVKRLQQIQLRSRMQFGTAQAFERGPLREELGLTDDQIEKLREASEEITKETNEKIAKIREDARKEILESALTAEQMAKLEDLLGEPFEIRRTFQRGGGQGGRGGRTGGGNRPQRPDQ